MAGSPPRHSFSSRSTGPARALDMGPRSSHNALMTTWHLDALRARRDEIVRLAALRGAGNVRVFGSVARAQAHGTSDVDLLVEFERGRSLLDHGGLVADLEEFLDCRVDVVSERALRPRFKERVLREAVSL
jgi:hypothetical protein